MLGEAELASAEKGERAYAEAVKQLCRFVEYFHKRPKDQRSRHQRHAPQHADALGTAVDLVDSRR